MTQYKNLRVALAAAGMIGGMALLAGCSSPPPPQTTSTTTQETTTTQAPAPGPAAAMPGPMSEPGAPATVTTKTERSETSD
jgi:hypothetical protein